MAAYINQISTAVPDHYYEQDFLRERMKEYLGNREATSRIIHRIYSRSGIRKRHTVVNDFHGNGDPRFFFGEEGQVESPSTGTRNRLYARHARPLFVKLAGATLEESGMEPERVTHVITVSCTGFFAPEPAFHIIRELGLRSDTQRYHIGFMGCFAAFPALRMARSFCESDPESVVLIVCVELCSLHFQGTERTDNLISESVFADGGAGALVSADPVPGRPAFRIDRFSTAIADNSEEDMAWMIGDTGFEIALSTYVPDIIRAELRSALVPVLEGSGAPPVEIGHWAVHPGGRAILDKVGQEMDLPTERLEASRSVLREYGNMSSATILFVLQKLLYEDTPHASPTLALAFGPGLTIESALLSRTDSTGM